MARNRQRAKERQARRKAEQRHAAGAASDGGNGREGVAERPNGRDEVSDEVRKQVEREVGAPPQELGRSDAVVEAQPELEEEELDLEEEEHFDPGEDRPEEDAALSPGPRGHRGDAPAHKDRPRFVQFLSAVRAELRRVQWPDRQALTTLTGVVLGFVIVAGGYLGLLDAIASRLVKAIL